MRIQLSDQFTYSKLLRFTLPSIAMMIISSIYGVVDGLFVSNFVGKIPFAAINFITPVPMMLSTLGFMLGVGGSALVSKTMGEGDGQKAKEQFSLFVYTTILCGIAVAALAWIFLRKIAGLMGAEGEMLEYCVRYGRIVLLAFPFYMLQLEFHTFCVTAERPQMGFWVTLASGISNILLDALFIAVFQWGIVGAAAATAISQLLGGLIPLLYFLRPNDSRLQLVPTRFDGGALLKACTNGASELMGNISSSIVSLLYNTQLMKYAGEDGVAAYGVLMYVNMIFVSCFIGYGVGTSSIVGYQYGAQDHAGLKNLLKKSAVVLSVFSVTMFLLGEALARPLATIFVSYDPVLMEMTLKGFRIFSFSFLFVGVAQCAPTFFTALSDGLVSAIVAFLRIMVFQAGSVLLLSALWGLDGIWYSTVVAEVLSTTMSLIFIIALRNKYHYL